MGEPARNYSWEPFQPGNTLSLRHAAYSEGVIQPLADDLAHHLLERRVDG
jgi:hypothetical protein